jgi:hypothetical protein
VHACVEYALDYAALEARRPALFTNQHYFRERQQARVAAPCKGLGLWMIDATQQLSRPCRAGGIMVNEP